MSDCHEAIDCGREMFRGYTGALSTANASAARARRNPLAMVQREIVRKRSIRACCAFGKKKKPLSERHRHAENFPASVQGPEFPLSEVGQKDDDIRGHQHCHDDDANGNSPRSRDRPCPRALTPQRRIGWVRRDDNTSSRSCRNNHVEANGAATALTSCAALLVLGPPPFCALMPPTLRVLVFAAVGSRSLWVASPGVMSQPLCAWSVLGSPPLCTVRHCTGQVATDPQYPEGGSQRACHHGGCPPHGF